MKEVNIVSFGAGQNSTAMIIYMVNNNIRIDEIILADVGNEYPETYKFIEEFKEYCSQNKIKFTIVKSVHYPLNKYYSDPL